MLGQRFGRLVVVSFAGRRLAKRTWNCVCDCGKRCVAHGYDLRHGKHKSCGCLHLESIRRHGHTKHGGSRTRTYSSWSAMISRCTDPAATHFERYGGRGIKICERWRTFENFLADLGERPEGKSLDRIDNDGNYEPGNCRWATNREQSLNRSDSRYIEFNGLRKRRSEWAEEYGIHPETLRCRLRKGWSVEKALTEPIRGRC